MYENDMKYFLGILGKLIGFKPIFFQEIRSVLNMSLRYSNICCRFLCIDSGNHSKNIIITNKIQMFVMNYFRKTHRFSAMNE